MKLCDPIQVRLDAKTHAELKAAAQAKDITVSTLIRERLQGEGAVAAALTALRADLALAGARSRHALPEPVSAPPPAPTPSAKVEGMLAELLLLLRISNPERSRMAQTEVARLGLPVWRSGR